FAFVLKFAVRLRISLRRRSLISSYVMGFPLSITPTRVNNCGSKETYINRSGSMPSIRSAIPVVALVMLSKVDETKGMPPSRCDAPGSFLLRAANQIRIGFCDKGPGLYADQLPFRQIRRPHVPIVRQRSLHRVERGFHRNGFPESTLLIQHVEMRHPIGSDAS